MTMTSNNPAAQQGWVKSTDPKTGRVFYANHITRKTQWEKPDNWIEEEAMAPPPNPYEQQRQDEDDELPSNWEVMHDPTTGKPFYVDHERKITTWTKPTVQRKSQPSVISHAPAPVATSTSSLQRIMGSSTSAYHAPASYYTESFSQPHQWHQEQVDFSDSMPTLEFSVKKVEDALRPNCPHCDSLFTMSKRRHHCRLCGDVFCDACSSHRVDLPLEGPEFEKPVRICDFCNKDVEKGNFFSLRRYFTPILLYKPGQHSADQEEGVASASNVNAALAAMTSDFDQMLTNPSTTIEEKVTIPPDVFIPALVRHLYSRETADRTVRAIASLLALESIAGKSDYAHAIFLYGGKEAMESILALLERTGSDRRTLYIQEQAARAMFYLTEPKILKSLVPKHAEMSSKNTDEEYGNVDSIDLSRALRNFLDLCSVTKNPNLQRWSTSTIHHLVLEDQRRACLAVNEVAASVASGEAPNDLEYTSFLDQLVSTGGVMILCSLIGAEDADIRAHAVGAAQAVLSSTRIMDNSRAALAEMTGGQPGGTETKDGEVVRAIVAGGGCSSSVSQLLISADNTVAGMGCDFCAALVGPLLSQAAATASLPREYDWRNDNDGMGACREAALEIATGSCLPALLSLVREHAKRPVELKRVAMETLAAVVLAVGEIGRAWAGGKYEEGLERTGAPAKLKEALVLLNEEGAIDAALEVLQSSSAQSLGSAADTPASRVRECAGIILASLTSCSAEAIMELQTRKVVSPLLLASNDASMLAPSTLRGDTAPRCIGVLEAVASMLMFAWQHPSGASSELLDGLIEALDVGAISFLSKVLSAKVEWDSRDKAVGGMKARTACMRLLCCLFGIALTDETGIGMKRLMDAVDADSYNYHSSRQQQQQRGPQNIVEAVLGSLQVASSNAKKMLMGSLEQGQHYQTALMDMLEAAVLATGSMCGSSIAPGGGEGTLIEGENFLELRNDEFVSRRRDICGAACSVVVRGGKSGPSLLPTMLVGGFGEGTVLASLRLSLAIAQNGVKQQHAQLALSGIMVPISDILRNALSNGDLFKFSAALALVRFCGPHVASNESGGLQSVRDAIRIATNVLTLPIPHEATIEQIETQESLKSECISALESLSHNASLWNAISTDALPSMVHYLQSTGDNSSGGARRREARCSALKVFLQLVQVPSHAVAAAEAGLAQPLGKLMRVGKGTKAQEEADEVSMLALEVIQVLAKNDDSRRRAQFLDTGVARDICSAIGNAATEKPKKPTDSRANITVIGLEVLHTILSDVERDVSTQSVLQSSAAIAFLDAVASERHFVRAISSTLLLKTGMKVPIPDSDDGTAFDIPKLYGPPLVLVREDCGGYDSTHDAAAAILFAASVYACAIDSKRSEAFWNTCLLKDISSSGDALDCSKAAAALSAHFLALLDADFKPFMPVESQREEDFNLISKPLVRHRLLEALRDSIEEASKNDGEDQFFAGLFAKFNVPKILISLWRDPALLDLAFGLMKQVVDVDPDDILYLFVESKEAILALFNMLNLEAPAGTQTNIGEVRRFLASVLNTLAENGQLADAVTRFDVRSSAISALAAACLAEEEHSGNEDDDEDITSNRLSSNLMGCLVELCTVRHNNGETKIVLSSVEAESIAKNLGKKICHMVLSRFLERAKLQEYEMEEEEEIMKAPDVAMLCAVAQHDNALQILRRIGGLHALSQIASEGELSAVLVLKKACEDDFSLLLEADTFLSIMTLFSKEDHLAEWRAEPGLRRQLETAAFELLGNLCEVSPKGRKSVGAADACNSCIARAVEAVSLITNPTGRTSPNAENNDGSDDSSNGNGVSDALLAEPSANDSAQSTSDLVSMENAELCAAGLLFLAALVPIPSVRKDLLNNDEFIQGATALVTCDSQPKLQYEAVKLMKSLAPFATSGQTLNPDRLATVLLKVLKFDSESKKEQTAKPTNDNLLHGTAVAGIQVIFTSLESKIQLEVGHAVSSRFSKAAKNVAVAKGDRLHGGQLAHNLTSMLLLARGNDSTEEIFTAPMMTSLINMVQWRYDPKTRLEDPDTPLWNASVTHCLQLLSLSLMTTEERLAKIGIQPAEIAKTVLMLARPGKAPRKSIDLASALSKAIQSGDAAASVAAQQVTKLLF